MRVISRQSVTNNGCYAPTEPQHTKPSLRNTGLCTETEASPHSSARQTKASVFTFDFGASRTAFVLVLVRGVPGQPCAWRSAILGAPGRGTRCVSTGHCRARALARADRRSSHPALRVHFHLSLERLHSHVPDVLQPLALSMMAVNLSDPAIILPHSDHREVQARFTSTSSLCHQLHR